MLREITGENMTDPEPHFLIKIKLSRTGISGSDADAFIAIRLTSGNGIGQHLAANTLTLPFFGNCYVFYLCFLL